MRYPIVNRAIFRRFASNSARGEKSVTVDINETDQLDLRTGHIARFASGAVVASAGDSSVMATCVQNTSKQGDGQPFSVEYRPSASAVGRIPTNFLRREMSQSDNEILIGRAIDRSLRPLIPQISFETQVVVKPLVIDDGDQLMLGINAASTALHVSSVPFAGPLAALRVTMDKSGKIRVNPSLESSSGAQLNMILAMTRNQKLVMLELDAHESSTENIEAVLDVGFREVEGVLDGMDRLKADLGNEKICARTTNLEEVEEIVTNLARERIYYVLTDSTHDKTSRDVALRNILNDISESATIEGLKFEDVQSVFYKQVKEVLRETILKSSVRCDGRKINEFRPITIQTNMYKKLHGCSMFQRGQTQVLTTATFDSPSAAFRPDSVAQLLGSQQRKSFMLHYEFPGFATNEIKPVRSANRREIGHGALAEKALKNLFPDDFPYAVRLACQVLESNGSSSMASVCGGSLAMYDAGVPLKNAAAGVAIGLVTDENKPDENYQVLTDILGIEDYAGDMDFKIAGTKDGFTAAQMDVKIGGLTRKQFTESLAAGRKGIDHVLSKMNVIRDRAREEFKTSVPIIQSMRIEPHKRVTLFRNNGYNCKLIEVETGVKVTAEDETSISFFAQSKKNLQKAKDLMQKILEQNDSLEFAFGSIVSAEIVEIVERGVFVNLPGSSRRIFMSNAHLSPNPVKHADVLGLKVGDKMSVHWFGRDEQTGNIRLSRKTLSGASSRATVSKK